MIRNRKQTMVDLAIENDLGYNEIIAANPAVDPWYPKKEMEITLPTSWIMPEIDGCLANVPGPYYTVQLGSYRLPEGAWQKYNSFSDQTVPGDKVYLRLEKLGPYYSVRSGLFTEMDESLEYFHRMKLLFPDAMLISTHIKKDIILYPSALPPLPAKEKLWDPSCIVVNLAELRLYHIAWGENAITVRTFPVGIGKNGTETIRGRYRVIEKLTNPVWIIPPSLQQKYSKYSGSIPPGPDNPLGHYALRLSKPDYLIHGTNKLHGIGRQVSHGCIRMYPDDIEKLHSMTNIEEEVIILYQPVKIGEKDGTPYIEVHEDYLKTENPGQRAISLLQKQNLLKKAELSLMFQALKEKTGIPVSLGNM